MIELDQIADERGFFARSWCEEDFRTAGLVAVISQANISYNKRAGTIRGMHYQVAPHEERKLVRCVRGSIFDVVVDLRSESPTYCGWFGEELTADNRRTLYIPAGCAHGFQTLEDDTEVHYLMSGEYNPDTARGVRYDDPAFDIDWPLRVSLISGKDKAWPLLAPDRDGANNPGRSTNVE